jgi:predicted amidohydrolase YtcJ
MRPMQLAWSLVSLIAAAPLMAAEPTVLTASRIHTMDPRQPKAEALAFDADGRIVAVGSRDELLKRYPKGARIDAGNATVVPGLIDAHGHVAGLGLTKLRVDLVDTESKAQVLQRLREFEKTLPAGAWLLGRGWDQNDWPEKNFPTAADLDAAFPTRPVFLVRVDGHAGWANTAAMRAVKRDLAGDWQPDGGQVVRENGKPSGVFVDAAMELVEQAIPALDDATAERALALGMREAVAHGLTGVHDMGVSREDLQRYTRLADRGEVPLRINALADGDNAALAELCRSGLYRHPSGRLQMRGVKLYIDGALGSRGAAMLEDYSDHAGHRGLMLMQPDTLTQVTTKARKCGVQVATHAIGDRGNREVLDVFGRVLGDARDHRWRIEHAQIVAPDDLARFAKLGVIASMQPTHATSDMPWAEERVGPERIVGAYAWRQLRDSGARLALGSDFPVESVDPRLGLYSAVSRADAQGRPTGGWLPQEKLTAHEALRGFTLDAAYAGFAEDEVGSLEVGKRADFVVLAQDPLAVEPKQLRELDVQATYVDGRAVYRKP